MYRGEFFFELFQGSNWNLKAKVSWYGSCWVMYLTVPNLL